jgi:hypothetical protein
MKLTLREVPEKEKQRIERLENLSLDDLYTEFGQQIGSLGATKDAKEQVSRYLEQKRQDLHKIICLEGNYCVFIKENKSAKFIDISAAIADLLAPYFAAIPVNTLAVLVVRTIISDLCNCEN